MTRPNGQTERNLLIMHLLTVCKMTERQVADHPGIWDKDGKKLSHQRIHQIKQAMFAKMKRK